MQQEQFLRVIGRDEAERRFRDVLELAPLAAERVELFEALYRVLAEDIVAPVDVPSFDRSNMDGFAVRAADTFGATEDQPSGLELTSEVISPGIQPGQEIRKGFASVIATGAMIPRGADAVVMIEDTECVGNQLRIVRPVTPGANVSFAGSDIGRGETVLHAGEALTSRETGVLAALGIADVLAVRRPRVAILSTGNELIPPGQPMKPGLIYDSNSVILADAVRELGGEPHVMGIVPDDSGKLRAVLEKALEFDVVLVSGGTSKGEGDICYRVVSELGKPGIVAHGVALKPGKPLCLAAVKRRDRAIPVVILPGFPTSAIFTFHEFVAPVILRLGGRREETRSPITARLPMRVNSVRGRTEYVLVGLVESESTADAQQFVAYPMGKGSGSVTAFSRADGFIIIPQHQEYLREDTEVAVHLLDRNLRPADLVVIGSHCVGLDYLLSELRIRGVSAKCIIVGSTAGLQAAKRGECDLAGVHLLDEKTGEYNRPFLTEGLTLLTGYRRQQGIVFRAGDQRFANRTLAECLESCINDPDCLMINRNRGSGTRILIDRLLKKSPNAPAGYLTEAKSHSAVAAAVVQGRADWGVAIETVARDSNLGFVPIQGEHFDFVIPSQRIRRPALQMFRDLLTQETIREQLTNLGFVV